MKDKEKIISGLNYCLGDNDCDTERNGQCPYSDCFLCAEVLKADLMKLINDRKKTKALPIMGTTICECYNCKHLLAKGMDYCPVCGYEISEAPWKMDKKDEASYDTSDRGGGRSKK